MADNVKLSAGTNDGANLRTLEEASGVEWPASVLAYPTTVSPGANVMQLVQVGHGLPVVQDGTWTVTPGETPNTNPWNVSIKQGGNTATVTADGELKVVGDITVGSIASITNPVTVSQGTASNLLCTASQGGSWTVASTQSGTWNVGTVSTVSAVTSITNPVAATQSGSWNVGVTGSVTVAQGTAANLLCTASQGGTWNVGITGTPAVSQSGTWNVGTVSTVTAVTGITNPVAVTQSGTWTVGLSSAQTLANVTTVGTITNPVTVAQATAGNLNCTANQGGTWNIGTVTTLTGVTNPVTVAQSNASSLKAEVAIAASQTLATVTTVGTITNPVGLAAGTNLVGRVSASDETSTVYNGTTAVTPKFAKIVASSSGNTSVVALVASKKIRVVKLSFVANGAVNVKFQSNTTDITGRWFLTQFASGGGGYCPLGLFETAVGEALNINLSAAVGVEGMLTYLEI